MRRHMPGIIIPAGCISRILEDPARAFHREVWALMRQYVPSMAGRSVCVPSSGDNLAVFAFALLGAQVTSCDISENQLAHAQAAAERMGISARIRFVCTNTMTLSGLPDRTFDFVYTSNGVHVWIDDLAAMYRSVYRIMRPGAYYLMYDVHPFQRPFDQDARIIKPYDRTGPYEDVYNVNFAWLRADILNAAGCGLRLSHIAELFAEKDYEAPYWAPVNRWWRGRHSAVMRSTGCMTGAKTPWPRCPTGCAWPRKSHKTRNARSVFFVYF